MRYHCHCRPFDQYGSIGRDTTTIRMGRGAYPDTVIMAGRLLRLPPRRRAGDIRRPQPRHTPPDSMGVSDVGSVVRYRAGTPRESVGADAPHPADTGRISRPVRRNPCPSECAGNAQLSVRPIRRGDDHADNPPANPLRHVVVERAMRGLTRRSAGAGQKQAPAVRLADLERILATADAGGDKYAARDTALISVMWWALLRVSEAVALRWGDVDPIPAGGGSLITIRRSKTDQEGVGEVRAIPERAAARLSEWYPQDADGDAPIWPIGTRHASAVIKRRAADAGIDTSSHGLRVGAATTLAEAGYSMSDIQNAGRWASPEMVTRYTRQRDATAGAMMRLGAK